MWKKTPKNLLPFTRSPGVIRPSGDDTERILARFAFDVILEHGEEHVRNRQHSLPGAQRSGTDAK